MFKIFLLLIVINYNVAQAGPLIIEKYDFYYVTPRSLNTLLSSLNAKTPIKHNGNTYYGHTHSSITWNFWLNFSRTQCYIETVNTQVDVTFILPKLTTNHPDIVSVWKQWLPKLKAHEEGHKNLAVETAMQIEKAIRALPSNKNCNAIEQTANNLAWQYIEELHKRNKQYDMDTNHGEVEGAFISAYLLP